MSYKMMRYILWIFAACFSTINSASADERWYDVELLVFKHAKAEHFLTEQWPTTWSIPDTLDSVDSIDIQKTYSDRFEKLSKEQQSFSSIIDSMEKSSRYEVLAYRGWRQQGLDKDQAVNVRIQAGKTYKKNNQSFMSSPASVAPASGQQEPETGTLFEPVLNENGSVIRYVIPQYTLTTGAAVPDRAVHELDGNIKIVLSRFLHIYTDLLLLEPVDLKPEKSADDDNLKTETDLVEETQDSFDAMETESDVTPAAYRLSPASSDTEFTTLHGFNIQNHRRMRSDETHHLDHPLIGIIVKVTPSDNNN